MNYVELLGYLAMLLVGLSFLMKDVIKLRFVNALGCICFSIYGILIGSFPVAALNGFVACTNIYFLINNNKD
ncbi:lactate dehydrogenase [[Haemophilus] ducreyi]|uniref:L-lactate dehydrogenase n=2 Tax=Haemophilus ducreyi TaxID=730 RepID=Q7VM76_HAEDU|nr:YgjV family protein [[Haemophilus] ducreyi]AAP95984.1 hypothetical protein HD_1120 [[Haemophilus] ducreyi 35000HP]AKO31607.1 lactate dehydrogenase [[Haemophilus] ducreyi]AKO32423.1 lactate dehydrogenase [[Haemophilus] ducreyi]AKO33873.1 lactate dehydrogenase [[Haemophilus] ducreyi]AKO35321.1 lactate dehydrogenase [[Haemophilus] ducreyi]